MLGEAEEGMTTVGWDDASTDLVAKIDFESAPFWLRVLARTPLVEKYAYPIAVGRGLGTIWIQKDSEKDKNFFSDQGWQVKIGEPDVNERILSGSLAKLSINFRSISEPLPRATRLGRELAWRKAIHEANGTLD